MPVTVRYSAALDRTYEDGDLLQPPASPSTDSGSGASTPASFRTDRTQSSTASPMMAGQDGDDYGSVDSLDVESVCSGGGNHSRQISSDSTEFIPTRTIKTNTKPAFNPLQFVKTGKSKLVKTAEQQIKQFEEVKKVKERVREDEEAWQSNLDNWKSKRRQISHKTIQKAEEIKQIEEVELDRQRKKSKTFNEMMEERSKRGTSSTLPTYDEWDHATSGDNEEGGASDENVATRGDVSFDSSGSDHAFNEDDDSKFISSTPISKAMNGNGEHKPTSNQQDRNGNSFPESHKPINGHTNDRSGASDEPEYTFDKAIQSYAQFAESHLRHPPCDDGHKVTSSPRDLSTRSPSSIDYTMRTNMWNDMDSRESSPKKTAAEDENHIEKMARANGQRLSIIVCLRRGSENKEFGFSIKSVRGIGSGIFVENVHPQSPADSAGLKVNDEILAINGEYCTSKRTHSAIVFAVKQAVYTGNLELEIYRYENTEQIQMTKSLASSSPAKVREASPQANKSSSLDRSSSETGLQHPPKVDLVKRRSVFEMSSRQSPEKLQNRRSLDVSVKIKDKLASFENGDALDRETAMDFRKSPKHVSAFQEKLASFRSLDSLNRSSPSRDSRKEQAAECNSNVVSEMMDEDSTDFELHGVQSFERTRSCECLDYDERENVNNGLIEESRVVGNVDQQFETDLSELKMLVSLADRENTSACSAVLSDLEEDSSTDRHVYESMHLENSTWLEKDGAALQDRLYSPKSGFELAESLEETPITGSVPTSPCEVNTSQEFSLNFRQEAEADMEIALNSQDAVDLNPEKLENLDLSGEVLVIEHVDAPLKTLEPPKEKPPPPPVDLLENGKKVPDKLKRVDSTKRIRTEIWKRRTDFLGIDGEDVQKLMQHDIESVTPPPTLENLLREDMLGQNWKDGEIKLEDAEASRESNAPLEDEKEIARREREIIENLEWEEQLVQEPQTTASEKDFNLNDRNLEPEAFVAEEFAFERKMVQESFAVPIEKDTVPQSFYPDSDMTLKMREEELQRQEELLRLEKEKLRKEQEELLRQKEAYQKRIEDHQRGSIGTPASVPSPNGIQMSASPKKDVRSPTSPIYETIQPPSLLSPDRPTRTVAQPPLPPNKPKIISPVFNDRIHSVSETSDSVNDPDKWPMHPRITDEHHVKSDQQSALQPLTKQALSALSASPKVKLMDNDQWMARRKTNGQRRENYNQHWLVQEAEFRRLHPQQQQQQQQQQDNQKQSMQGVQSSGDANWQHSPPQSSWKVQPTNGNYSPSNSNGIYSASDLVNRSPGNQVQSPAQRLAVTSHRPQPTPAAMDATYAVPQHLQHRQQHAAPLMQQQQHAAPLMQQQQHLFSPPQERRQDIVTDASPPIKVAPPPHPPKPSKQTPKSVSENSADRDSSASQMLSVSGKKKCSHCAEELGRGAAMIIESLQLFYHINCFKCCVCHIQLGNGTSGADVRVRSQKLHCHNCYSNDEGLKFSKV